MIVPEIEFETVNKNKLDETKLEIGDVLVTLAIMANQIESTLDECFNLAYDKIKNRTGKTINGTFIKD